MTHGALQLLDAASKTDRTVWLDHWLSWPAREVQAHPAYVSAFAGADERPLVAALRSDAGSVLFPFLLRRVSHTVMADDLVDITTPYGYGGAYAWEMRDRAALGREFWNAFDLWASTNGVVSEFVRLSLFDHTLLPYPGELTAKQDNVVADLTLTSDELWMSFEHKVRKNVNRARRSGIEIRVDTTGERFSDFHRIYAATMDRRGAASAYYFDRHFFETIHRELPGRFAYFHAHDGDAVVSTELILLSEESGYSFLGGTLQEAFPSRPNDLLKVEIMRWLAESGRRWFVLGGGYEPDDGIFRYKRAFAPQGVRPFKVGTRIVDHGAYRRLSGNRVTANAGFFPAYRA